MFFICASCSSDTDIKMCLETLLTSNIAQSLAQRFPPLIPSLPRDTIRYQHLPVLLAVPQGLLTHLRTAQGIFRAFPELGKRSHLYHEPFKPSTGGSVLSEGQYRTQGSTPRADKKLFLGKHQCWAGREGAGLAERHTGLRERSVGWQTPVLGCPQCSARSMPSVSRRAGAQGWGSGQDPPQHFHCKCPKLHSQLVPALRSLLGSPGPLAVSLQDCPMSHQGNAHTGRDPKAP